MWAVGVGDDELGGGDGGHGAFVAVGDDEHARGPGGGRAQQTNTAKRAAELESRHTTSSS